MTSSDPPAISTQLAALRQDYALKTLEEAQVDRDPLKQFGVWLVEAIHAQVPEPTAMHLATVGPSGRPSGRIVLLKGLGAGGFVFYTNYASRKGRELETDPTAMTLATATADGRPSARIVLLKAVDARGFVFYTNYESRKARDLAAHPAAALTILWKELERQVRIEGTVQKVAAAESDEYFATRPLGSRIGAWASPQSDAIEGRAWLEARWAELAAQFGEHPPRPPHWGGYRLVPDHLEFWQGRLSRLHDRITYSRAGNAWKIARLAP